MTTPDEPVILFGRYVLTWTPVWYHPHNGAECGPYYAVYRDGKLISCEPDRAKAEAAALTHARRRAEHANAEAQQLERLLEKKS